MSEQRQEDIKQAGLRSRTVMAWLRDHHLPAEPVCYTVAYEYLFTDNKELKIQVDSLDFEELESKLILEQIYKTNIIDKHYEELSMKCGNTKEYVSEVLSLLLNPVSTTAGSNQKPLIDPAMNQHAMNDDPDCPDTPIHIESSPDLYLQIKDEASVDPLTMILDQKGVMDTVKEAIKHEDNHPLSVIRLELDHFKNFQDTHGMKMADAAIKQSARMMQNQLKGRDIISRYQNDEFLVILPKTAMKHGVLVADLIRKKVAGLTLRKRGSDIAAKFTVSAGVSEYAGECSFDKVMKAANQALARSKDNGHNCVNQELPNE
jgi:diguanylate cyclase